MRTFSVNLHNLGFSEHSYPGDVEDINGDYILLPDGIYKKDNSLTALTQYVETGLIANKGNRSYTYDVYIDREDEVPLSMEVTSKEGSTVSYDIPVNWTKSDLAKGHQSRYFSYKVTASTVCEFKGLFVVLQKSKRLL